MKPEIVIGLLLIKAVYGNELEIEDHEQDTNNDSPLEENKEYELAEDQGEEADIPHDKETSDPFIKIPCFIRRRSGRRRCGSVKIPCLIRRRSGRRRCGSIKVPCLIRRRSGRRRCGSIKVPCFFRRRGGRRRCERIGKK